MVISKYGREIQDDGAMDAGTKKALMRKGDSDFK